MNSYHVFTVPQTYVAPNGEVINTGELVVEYKVTTYRQDGTMRTIDINQIEFSGNFVTDYISACQPDKWDELMAAATNNFKSLNNEQ